MKHHIVKGLNEPYTRFDFVVGGVCSIVDGIVDILSFGYVRAYLRLWWMRKITKRGLKHIENNIDAQVSAQNVESAPTK